MQCSNCGTENDNSFRFCMKCGAKFAGEELRTSEERGKQSVTIPSVHSTPVPRQEIQHPQYQTSNRQAAQIYPYPQVGHPQGKPFGASNLSSLNIWGPFAGFGNRRHHASWLMDGQGSRARELISKVATKFSDREIPHTTITQENLVARGLLVENRPYFILRRGLVSLALYIAEFGRDLFISLAAYLKPPISNFRVLIVCLMLLFEGYLIFIYPSSLNRAFERALSNIDLFGRSSPDLSALITLLCFVGTLGMMNTIALFLLFIFSTYKWLSNRDFLAPLRISPNEFNEDDLMAMEKAVEQTVRISLDEIGLNPDDLKPADTSNFRRII